MTRKRKILFLIASVLVMLGGLFVLLVGPWPTYRSGYQNMAYYERAVAEIEQRSQQISTTSPVGRLHAGWAVCSMTPPIGTPLAGYGDRRGRPSTGVHDELYVRPWP